MSMKELLETADVFADPMLLVSVDGTIEATNPPFAEQFGLTAEKLAGKRLETLAALSASAIEEYLQACARSDKALGGALLFRRRAAAIPYRARGVAYPPQSAPSASHVLLCLQAMREAGAQTAPHPVIHLDAHPQHWQEIEDSLRRQSRILEVTLASIGDAVIITDASARVSFMNSVAEALTGWSLEEARHRPLATVFRIVNERTRQTVEDPVAKVIESGHVVGLANHTVLLSRSGSEIPIDDSAAPIRVPEGELFGVILVFRDVTEQKRAEHARAWLASVVDSSFDAIVSKSLDGTITSWNPAAERLFGYSAAEIVGKPIMTIVPPDLAEEEMQVLERLRRGERVEQLETVRLTKSGRRIDVSLTISPIMDEGGEIVGASKIARDVSRQKKSERLLRDAERRKDEFLATLGHELRNPLAPIRNATEVLCRIEHAHPESQVACEILRRQVRVMAHLVDDLLDVSRISSGQLRLRQEAIELPQLLLNTVESLRHAFEAKGQLIGLSLAGETLTVAGDRTRLIQIFSNLLNNANKYTQEGGHIDVELARDRGDAVVRIRDDGMGIPAAMLDDIFELFAQVPRSRIGSDSGLGIGLTLAKRITEMHQGSIEAHSVGEGRGSEFVVRLPLVKLTEASADTPVGADPAPGGLRILIADDNKDSAMSLAMLLTSMGHEARVVYDGEAAVTAADEFQPSVVFLDLSMPKLNGYEAARRIAQQSWARATRLVALTGWGQPSDIDRTQAAGFHQHLVKPVELDVLKELLESAARD